MTTAARETEARAADVAFQVALAQIGVGTIEEALAVWAALDPTDVQATAEGWLNRAINLILGRRRMSRDLGMAYYRLARALRTGSTVADPFRPDPPYVTLADLRREFRDLVAEIDYIHGGEPTAPTGAGEPESDDDTQRVLVEVIEGLREEELRMEEAAEEAARKDLIFLGPNAIEERTAKLSPEDTLGETDLLIVREYRRAAARVAASSERLVLNGGRGSVYAYGSRDRRVLAWARVSLSGDPCSFCAMLISRGINYKSESSASRGAGVTVIDGQTLDAYHDNCRCIAVPIYSQSQFDSDPRFDQNRALRKEWDERIKDNYSGAEARNAWRRFIEQARRDGTAYWLVPPIDSPALVAG